MSSFLSKKSIGFYLSAVAALLSLVGFIVYATDKAVGAAMAMFIIAFIAEVALIVASCFIKSKYLELISVLAAVLITVGIGISLFFRMEQIGWCASGLDPFSVLTKYFVSIAMNVVALIAATAACFFTQNRKDA